MCTSPVNLNRVPLGNIAVGEPFAFWANRTHHNMLSSFVSNRKDDWDLWLDIVTFAHNTSRHDVLGVSNCFWSCTSTAVGVGVRNATFKSSYTQRVHACIHLGWYFVTLDKLQSSSSTKYPRNEPHTNR